MRTQDARRLPIDDLLARLGHEPVLDKGDEVWYLSPFRQETCPSFHIHRGKNIWYDFGLGEGGNVIDFMLHYEKLGSVSAVLGRLDSLMEGKAPTLPPKTPIRPVSASSMGDPTPSRLTVVKVQPLQHGGLHDYLRSRAIDPDLARPVVKELYYTLKEDQARPYFALAFPNRSATDHSGYELRSAYFQGCVGQKDVSLLGPTESGTIRVFEGFMDYLSYLTLVGRPTNPETILVLNGVSLGSRAIETLQELPPADLHLYLDRDQAGTTLREEFMASLPQHQITDKSAHYAGYKDVNAYLQDQSRQQPPRQARGR